MLQDASHLTVLSPFKRLRLIRQILSLIKVHNQKLVISIKLYYVFSWLVLFFVNGVVHQHSSVLFKMLCFYYIRVLILVFKFLKGNYIVVLLSNIWRWEFQIKALNGLEQFNPLPNSLKADRCIDSLILIRMWVTLLCLKWSELVWKCENPKWNS